MPVHDLDDASFLWKTFSRGWHPPRCPHCDGRMMPDLSVMTHPVYQCVPCGSHANPMLRAVRTVIY